MGGTIRRNICTEIVEKILRDGILVNRAGFYQGQSLEGDCDEEADERARGGSPWEFI